MFSLIKPLKNNRGITTFSNSNLMFILFIVVLVIIVWKFLPVKVRAMKFDEQLQDIVQPDISSNYALINRSESKLTADIINLAGTLGLPEMKSQKNVKVKKLDNQRFVAVVQYQETIRLPGYTYVWPFKFKAEQKN